MKNAEKQGMRGRLSGIDLIKTIAIICIIITHYPFTDLERKCVSNIGGIGRKKS